MSMAEVMFPHSGDVVHGTLLLFTRGVAAVPHHQSLNCASWYLCTSRKIIPVTKIKTKKESERGYKIEKIVENDKDDEKDWK